MSDLQLQQVISEATQKVAEQSGSQAATPGEASAENVARFESAMDGGQPQGQQGTQATGQTQGVEQGQRVDGAQQAGQAQAPENANQTPRTESAQQTEAVQGKSAAQQAQEFADGHKARIENVKNAMSKGSLSPPELISLHFDVMQVTFGQQLTKTVADEAGKGVKTLFNRSS